MRNSPPLSSPQSRKAKNAKAWAKYARDYLKRAADADKKFDAFVSRHRTKEDVSTIFLDENLERNSINFVARMMQTPKREPEGPWGESLPTKLLRDGWTPHSFPNSAVVVALPPGVTGRFDDKGVLHGFARGLNRFFTATLHTNLKFTQSRELALEFVGNLAKKKGAQAVDVATYRYFIDPTEGREDSRIITFYVIGIPGAVVVVSLSRQPDSPPSDHVERIRHAIPQIVGELV